MQLLLKTLITVALVVGISEVSRRSSFIGGLLASLPMTSLLAIVWLYHDTRDAAQVADLTSAILWLVLPSLVFFIALPLLLRAQVAFWPSLFVSSGVTIVAYYGMVKGLQHFGVAL